MTDLGVEINLSKSVQSVGGLMEFAKRLVTPGQNYSPVSSRGLLSAFRNGLRLPALFTDILDKDWLLSPHLLLGSYHTVLAAYGNSSARAKAFVGLVATLGPTGPLSLPIPEWIALRCIPEGWGEWLRPGLSSTLPWVIVSSLQQERESASSAILRSLRDFLGPVLLWWEELRKYE